MKITFAALIGAALLAACSGKPSADGEIQRQTPDGLALAIPEPQDASRRPPEFAAKSGEELGLPFSLSLPPGGAISKTGEAQWRASTPDGAFDLLIDQSANDITAIKALWAAQPEGLRIRAYLLDTPYGFLVEAERDQKAEYHLEYLYFKVNRTWRFHTPKNRAFSRSQAEKMFHACRLLRGNDR